MTTILKQVFSLALIITLMGCQNDASKESNQKPSQQPGSMGQLQQPPAPDIDPSEEEVDKFVDAAMNAQEVQMKAQKEMVGIIKNEGLDIKTYQKIARSTQSDKSAKQSGVSESQMKRYKSATDSIRQVQGKMQGQIATAVEDAGLKMQRFRLISQAARQDTQLRKQIQTKIQEKMKEGGGMPTPKK